MVGFERGRFYYQTYTGNAPIALYRLDLSTKEKLCDISSYPIPIQIQRILLMRAKTAFIIQRTLTLKQKMKAFLRTKQSLYGHLRKAAMTKTIFRMR